MKKNQNLFTRSVPPLLFVLIVPRSSQYDPSVEFILTKEGLRACLRDISAIRRLFNDAVSDLPSAICHWAENRESKRQCDSANWSNYSASVFVSATSGFGAQPAELV